MEAVNGCTDSLIYMLMVPVHQRLMLPVIYK